MKEDKSFTWTPVEAESLRLQGMKVAVIGGTGGIGRAFSRLFAARGAEVIVVGRSFRDAGTPGLQFRRTSAPWPKRSASLKRSLPRAWTC
jgi:lactate dehydrogenase-like 2-hydroxyacid dehydrogenase